MRLLFGCLGTPVFLSCAALFVLLAIPGNLWVAIDEEHGSCTWGSAPDPEVFQGMGVSSELSDAPVQARMGGVQTGGGFMRLHHQR